MCGRDSREFYRPGLIPSPHAVAQLCPATLHQFRTSLAIGGAVNTDPPYNIRLPLHSRPLSMSIGHPMSSHPPDQRTPVGDSQSQSPLIEDIIESSVDGDANENRGSPKVGGGVFIKVFQTSLARDGGCWH